MSLDQQDKQWFFEQLQAAEKHIADRILDMEDTLKRALAGFDAKLQKRAEIEAKLQRRNKAK